jgi:hypothetical protein
MEENSSEQRDQETHTLSSVEKFKELQKQDWQLEGLIVGSIVYGLIHASEFLEENSLQFMSFFPDPSMVKGFFHFFTGISNILLSHLILLLLFRIFWVIEAFSPNTNPDRLYYLNENASRHLSFGFRWFVFALIGAPFSFSILYILGFPVHPLNILVSTFSLFIWSAIFFSIGTTWPKWLGWLQTILLTLINPFFLILNRLTFFTVDNLSAQNNFNVEFREYQIEAYFYKYSRLSAGAFIFWIKYKGHLLLLLLIFSYFGIKSINSINRFDPSDKVICVDNKIKDYGYVELFIDGDIGLEYDIDKVGKKSFFKQKKIKILINKKPSKLNWYFFSDPNNSSSAGLRCFIENKELSPGLNFITVSTTGQNNFKYKKEFEVYKAGD